MEAFLPPIPNPTQEEIALVAYRIWQQRQAKMAAVGHLTIAKMAYHIWEENSAYGIPNGGNEKSNWDSALDLLGLYGTAEDDWMVATLELRDGTVA